MPSLSSLLPSLSGIFGLGRDNKSSNRQTPPSARFIVVSQTGDDVYLRTDSTASAKSLLD